MEVLTRSESGKMAVMCLVLDKFLPEILDQYTLLAVSLMLMNQQHVLDRRRL